MDAIVVGIDVSKDKLDIAVRPSGTAFSTSRDAGQGAVMWKKIWQFLQDEKNQRMLTVIGGGLVVVGGLWTA